MEANPLLCILGLMNKIQIDYSKGELARKECMDKSPLKRVNGKQCFGELEEASSEIGGLQMKNLAEIWVVVMRTIEIVQ